MYKTVSKSFSSKVYKENLDIAIESVNVSIWKRIEKSKLKVVDVMEIELCVCFCTPEKKELCVCLKTFS